MSSLSRHLRATAFIEGSRCRFLAPSGHPARNDTGRGRLTIERCDAILRLPGESKGADNDVRLAHERGIPVYYDIDEIPVYEG